MIWNQWTIFYKVGRENSRFRTLMAAQLNAAAGESLYLGPKMTDPQDGKEEEASKTEHRPRTDQHVVWFIFIDKTVILPARHGMLEPVADGLPLGHDAHGHVCIGICISHFYPFSLTSVTQSIFFFVIMFLQRISLFSIIRLILFSPAHLRLPLWFYACVTVT